MAMDGSRIPFVKPVMMYPARLVPSPTGTPADWPTDWSVSAGGLEVRLAHGHAEVEAAQALRYMIFYGEMAAVPTPAMAEAGRDIDRFDAVADHLLVLDHGRPSGPGQVVGTYRLLRRPAADRAGGFYSAGEYDIGPILACDGPILELGRSCVAPDHRTGQTMQLLWRGIAAYVFHHGIELMFGCASIPGVDPDRIATQLAYLHHFHLAPPALRPRALVGRYTEMARVPMDRIDKRAAVAALPPLIKGYLRLGALVGDGAVIDRQFHTTDVCVVLKTDLVTERYYRHYEKREGRPGV